jgi:hypothetical protein
LLSMFLSLETTRSGLLPKKFETGFLVVVSVETAFSSSRPNRERSVVDPYFDADLPLAWIPTLFTVTKLRRNIRLPDDEKAFANPIPKKKDSTTLSSNDCSRNRCECMLSFRSISLCESIKVRLCY